MTSYLNITVTRYNESDSLILETLESLTRQVNVTASVMFFDQDSDSNIQQCIDKLSNNRIDITRIIIPAISLSYARNQAIDKCQTSILLFIDSDAIAEPNWAEMMLKAFKDSEAAIVGGKIVLKWKAKPPLLAKSNIVREQYSCLDLGDDLVPSSKVIGASFGVDLSKLGKLAFFDEELGRRNGILLGGEETNLCRRAIKSGLNVFYQGGALVHHQVLLERISNRWIYKRLYYAGYSRAQSGGTPSPSHSKNAWDYFLLPIYFPPYLFGYFKSKYDV
ncbi:MAG: glycosyltransferase [Gammaproteobacteria bacterium]|nr:glycosyltransferase [Gammaproteobacteria bacterium]